MKINGKEIDINEITKEIYSEKSMLKIRGNGIYLSDNQIEVLKKYNINYQNYNSISSLIFEIENLLNEDADLVDLEEVSSRLAELNYYNNTNK